MSKENMNLLGDEEDKLFINGVFQRAKEGRVFNNSNPANNQVFGVAADASCCDVEQAVAAARIAFDQSTWSRDKALRKRCLQQLKQGLLENIEALRSVIVMETGAPMGIVKNGPQCDLPIEFIDYYISLIDNYEWEEVLPVSAGFGVPSKKMVWKEAAGVVAAITPWNFPLQINLAKIVPALAAGCTVILKPAPDTPWTATFLARIVSEYTDIPAGVFNVITASDAAEVGEFLCKDPRVDVISFTGSTQTGKHIMSLSASTVKKVFLELGGKSAHIVLDDADLPSALLTAFAVCFHAGQGCAIPTRFLVPKARHEESIGLIKNIFEQISYGEPENEGQLMGPLINKRQVENVLAYIKSGIEEGARLVVGGKKAGHLPDGNYIEPTLFADVSNDMKIAQEEIFGPVLCVIPYEADEEAITIANDSIFGLSGSIFSADQQRALAMARAIRTGTLNINGASFFSPDVPFGGYKQSGIGREMGIQGFEEYLETKVVAVPE